MREQRRQRGSRVLAGMLLCSAMLHGLAVLWLAWFEPAPATPPHPRSPAPVEVLITERPREPVTPEPPPTQPPPTVRPPKPAPSEPSSQVATREPAPTAPPTPPAQPHVAPREPVDAPESAHASEGAPSGSRPSRHPDIPYVDPNLHAQREPSERPTLTPSAEALAKGSPGGTGDSATEVPEDAPGIQAPRHRTPQQLVSETVEDTLALSRATRGAVHPYFQELGRALLAAWNPEPLVAKLGTDTIASRHGGGFKDTIQSWQKRAEVYGKTGSPLTDVKVGPLPRVLGGEDLSQHFAPQVAMGSQITADSENRRKMVMRLKQDRRGRLVDLYLVKPSALPELDRGALADIRAVGANLPVPPDAAVGPKDTLVSLWELELAAGWNTGAKDVSFDFAEAVPHSRWFKHLRLAGAN